MFVTERGLVAALKKKWHDTPDRSLCTIDKRIFSKKELSIAINAALSHPKDPLRNIARYSETRDLYLIQKKLGITKVTCIEVEKPLAKSEYGKKPKTTKKRIRKSKHAKKLKNNVSSV
jgi:hypothetical protein